MADISDVENALVAAAAAALYPTGTANPSAVGAPCKIFRGWPNAATLDADLLAGTVNVSVFSRTGYTRNTTRWMPQWTYSAMTVPTLTVAVNAAKTQVTVGGVAGVKQNVGLETSRGPWAVQAQATDGPAAVAAALAALVPNATAAGAVITLPYDPKLIARTGGTGTTSEEVRRQEQGIAVIVWSPTQPLRDATAATIDVALAATQFLALADGSAGHLTYANTAENDHVTKDRLWRRDLNYMVEYGTLVTKSAAQMLFGTETYALQGGAASITSYS